MHVLIFGCDKQKQSNYTFKNNLRDVMVYFYMKIAWISTSSNACISLYLESSVEIPLQSYIVNIWWIYDTLILFQETCMGEFAFSNGELRGRVKAKCIM